MRTSVVNMYNKHYFIHIPSSQNFIFTIASTVFVDMANLLEKMVIGLLEVVGCVYELIVFVPYYVVYKPYKKMERSQRIKVCLSTKV